VRITRRLEAARALDPAVSAVSPLVAGLRRSPGRRRLLEGDWLGHAVHPLLTDLPLGLWTSASVLDLVGGEESRPAAQRLVGLGILSAIPTAITGWAEWGGIEGQGDRRAGVAHAVANATAVWGYAASWHARRHGHHARGRNLALGAAVVAAAAGYLGAHLNGARDVTGRGVAIE